MEFFRFFFFFFLSTENIRHWIIGEIRDVEFVLRGGYDRGMVIRFG